MALVGADEFSLLEFVELVDKVDRVVAALSVRAKGLLLVTAANRSAVPWDEMLVTLSRRPQAC